MTIFVLIPVFNRLNYTQQVLAVLRNQRNAAALRIVVINDGSTDGTAAWLGEQPDVVEIRGDGSLWWGGAIQRGLEYVAAHRVAGDYVLFLNNDTWFADDYVETLVNASVVAGRAAVGSVIHEDDRDPPLVSVGPRININRIAVWDLFSELTPAQRRQPAATYKVDALSGRGTLYPVELFDRYGQMRTFWLPHYLADYEVAMRFGRAGVPLLVSSHAVVHSPPVYGNDVSRMGLWDRLFSPRSASNVIRRLAFYMLVGTPFQRLTAPLRMFIFAAWRALPQFQSSRNESPFK